ncbi:uncharacterized protein TRIADDRAFT_25440 [Trichoplax adhaerens]|uniref:Deoxyribonuclease n=1 Tax=Trichoplax adhaerens TaxID=10228 RepID=B3RWZ1_TRIAD|nr:hypothetical protein TRIADDRAFT_25440 [Trichoplax adhaerens]EDV25217.1 hypothetical protein TRIADDRAFT_25440 [Trichoplax adhaerens]|eukprot:XP_002113107.1 hypothetical protein TRIADDRAFT_25440 [Trichoplax adhaerens]
MLAIFSLAAEAGKVKIAAFNIQTLGKTKMGKQEVVAELVKILRRYDLTLIQEIRDSSGVAIQTLLDEVNKGHSYSYAMILSDRLGRSSYKEQYAFFYRTDLFSVQGNYHYDDGDESAGDDSFIREPFVVKFKITATGKQFVLIPCHASPSYAVEETDALADVYDDATTRFGESNAILMGDFNADCSYISSSEWSYVRLWTQSRFNWVIGSNADTTTKSTNCAYDRLVLAGSRMQSDYVSGTAKVFRFDSEYGLSYDETTAVSDHYPVEMELYD